MSEQAPHNPTVSEDEYLRAQTTEQFIDETTKAEEEISHFPTHLAVSEDKQGKPYIRRDMGGIEGWPDQRAHGIARELSAYPETGLDYDSAMKVRDMKEEAVKINQAHDIVTSDGATAEPTKSEKDIAKRLRGDNSVGREQEWGSMVRTPVRKYDIKDGVAMRGVSTTRTDKNGNIDLSSMGNDEQYVPFAPEHQKAAKKAMKSLAKKRMLTHNEKERATQVEVAKAVLGRAGVKIPKAKNSQLDAQTEQAA